MYSMGTSTILPLGIVTPLMWTVSRATLVVLYKKYNVITKVV